MISQIEAKQIVLQQLKSFGTEIVSVQDSLGRVLAEDILADRPFPPFDRVSMDGIAIRFDDFNQGNLIFKIEGIAAAGKPQMRLQSKNSCMEVMTGAVLPEDTDTVIRYEDLNIENGYASIVSETVNEAQNVHPKAFDAQKADRLIAAGKLISSSEIGILATVGKSQVSVKKNPKCAILSSGDELVDVDQSPADHQIRKSNVHQVKALLQSKKIEATAFHLQDDSDEIERKLGAILSEYELIILSGGVSKGKYDYIPEALEKLGVKQLFHRVKQSPGKPFWFGTHPNGQLVFAFPGNPVSSFVCSLNYLFPFLNKCMGIEERQVSAMLTEEFNFKPSLSFFKEVQLSMNESGELLASPVVGHGSGDLAKLVKTDAFLLLPEEQSNFKAGEVFPVLLSRDFF